MLNRIVKVKVSNSVNGTDFEMKAVADPVISDLIEINAEGRPVSSLTISKDHVTNVAGGEVQWHYVLAPGDFVEVLETVENTAKSAGTWKG